MFSEGDLPGTGPCDNVSMSTKSALEANGAIDGFVFYIVQSLPEGLLTALERRRHKETGRIRPISVLFLVSRMVVRTLPLNRRNKMRQAGCFVVAACRI